MASKLDSSSNISSSQNFPVSILPSDLTDDMIVVDVRKQLQFDKGHFAGAISLAFPQLLMRRLARTMSLDAFLISDTSVLTERHSGRFLVMYDDNTADLSTLQPSSPLATFCDIFSSEPSTKFGFVVGGFEAINVVYPSSIVATSFTAFAPKSALSMPPPNATISHVPTPVNNDPAPSFFLDSGFMAIGSEYNAGNLAFLEEHKITHVLNITTTDCSDAVKATRETMQIPILDSISQDIISHLEQALEFIHKARAVPGARLLIHCHAGISRSPSFAIAYVMWAERKTLEEAFALVHTHRSVTSPNLNFMGQLMIFRKFIPENPSEVVSLKDILSSASKYLCSL
jgi:dual specificity MAP kinase phosphatase